MNFGGGKFVRLCNQAHAVHLLCAPSVGPGYDGVRAGEAVVLSTQSSRRGGVTYDNLWTAALAAKPDIVTITSYNEWGEGTQIEAAAPHPRLPQLRRRLGPAGPGRRQRLHDAHGVLDRPLPFRPLAARRISGDGLPRGFGSIGPAAERADARAPRPHPGLRRAHGAGGGRPLVAGRDRLAHRGDHRSDRRVPRTQVARRVAVRKDRRPARRPLDDRLGRDPARRLRAADAGSRSRSSSRATCSSSSAGAC